MAASRGSPDGRTRAGCRTFASCNCRLFLGILLLTCSLTGAQENTENVSIFNLPFHIKSCMCGSLKLYKIVMKREVDDG